jgi:anti-sigma factor RsiW
MTLHEEWTDRLSEYLDGELTEGERASVEAHLKECRECTDVLNDLKRVVARAQASAGESRPPQADLWPGVARRIESVRQPRRVTLTLGQIAAAAVVVAAVSGGVVWRVARTETARPVQQAATEASPAAPADAIQDPGPASSRGARVETISLADAEYDAAVSDLEQALKKGRGRLDASTIAIVEHNLEIIDHAIGQAREALAADPANSYLSDHLAEARRRKLDLLRRATALTSDTD